MATSAAKAGGTEAISLGARQLVGFLSPHQSDIHADSHTEKSSNLQSDASLKMKSEQHCFGEKVT